MVLAVTRRGCSSVGCIGKLLGRLLLVGGWVGGLVQLC